MDGGPTVHLRYSDSDFRNGVNRPPGTSSDTNAAQDFGGFPEARPIDSLVPWESDLFAQIP